MKKSVFIVLGILLLGLIWYLVSPLFISKEVNDLAPGGSMLESSEVVGTGGHPATGVAKVLETEEGTIIRYEDFETINGPNLHLYLAKDLKAKDHIDLGPIKGTKGNINYLVPEGIDLSEYKYALHWCVPFRVLFNYVDLSQ